MELSLSKHCSICLGLSIFLVCLSILLQSGLIKSNTDFIGIKQPLSSRGQGITLKFHRYWNSVHLTDCDSNYWTSWFDYGSDCLSLRHIIDGMNDPMLQQSVIVQKTSIVDDVCYFQRKYRVLLELQCFYKASLFRRHLSLFMYFHWDKNGTLNVNANIKVTGYTNYSVLGNYSVHVLGYRYNKEWKYLPLSPGVHAIHHSYLDPLEYYKIIAIKELPLFLILWSLIYITINWWYLDAIKSKLDQMVMKRHQRSIHSSVWRKCIFVPASYYCLVTFFMSWVEKHRDSDPLQPVWDVTNWNLNELCSEQRRWNMSKWWLLVLALRFL
eukprot:375315_1